jgi:hypothetical protein
MYSTEITLHVSTAFIVCLWPYFHRSECDVGSVRCGHTCVEQMALAVVYMPLGGGSNSDWDGSCLTGVGITTGWHDC